jgi:hypothetical protein
MLRTTDDKKVNVDALVTAGACAFLVLAFFRCCYLSVPPPFLFVHLGLTEFVARVLFFLLVTAPVWCSSHVV